MSTKDEVARQLAFKHFDIERAITRVFRLRDASNHEDSPDTPIKLLEVNAETAPVGIMPLRFGALPAMGIPFSSIIIEVTPKEFEQLQCADLALPRGWEIAEECGGPHSLDSFYP